MTTRLGSFADLRQFLLHNGRSRIDQANVLEHLSTLKKVNRASDDPEAYRRIEHAEDQISQNQSFIENINDAMTRYDIMETAVTDIVDQLDEARELAIRGTSHLHDDLERETVADQIQNLREQILNRLNSKHEGSYLFSGSLTNTAAFDATGTYQGNADILEMRLSETQRFELNFTGEEIAFGAGGAGSATDIIEILDNLETAFRNNDLAAINAEIPRLRPATERLNGVLGDIGSRVGRLIAEKDHYQVFEEDLRSVLVQLEDADLAAEAVELEKVNQTLDAQLRSQGQINRNNLLNLIG